MSELNRKLIKNWLKKSALEEKPFDKFIALWIGYNGFYSNFFENGGDREKAITKMGNHLELKRLFEDDDGINPKVEEFFKLIEGRKDELGIGVKDLKKNKIVDIKREKGLKNFLKLIYTIRCNLFHGDKDIYGGRDDKLVLLAYEALYEIFSKFIKDS
ncbi:MAG: HEPN domain-containing protein [Candidatus Gracilibacteria bacterium]|nr:HEPN domain-containing protein [Candidatus Gracilibacteria bacterium]